MPIKMSIELDDFWMEEDNGGFEAELKDHITRRVIDHIYKDIEDKVKKELAGTAQKLAEAAITPIINMTISKVAAGEMFVKNRYSSNEEKCLDDVIKDGFRDFDVRSGVVNQINNYCERFAKDLRARYDMAFAAKIVQNMIDQKLVKDEAIAKLLEVKE